MAEARCCSCALRRELLAAAAGRRALQGVTHASDMAAGGLQALPCCADRNVQEWQCAGQAPAPRSRPPIKARRQQGHHFCGGQQQAAGIAASPSAVFAAFFSAPAAAPCRRLLAPLPYRAPPCCPSTLTVVPQQLKDTKPPAAIPSVRVSRPLDWDHLSGPPASLHVFEGPMRVNVTRGEPCSAAQHVAAAALCRAACRRSTCPLV